MQDMSKRDLVNGWTVRVANSEYGRGEVPSAATEARAPLTSFWLHPLDPLTPDETDIFSFEFITTYLLPPPKKAVLAYLGIALTPGGQPEASTPITRKAEVDVRTMTLAARVLEAPIVVPILGTTDSYVVEDVQDGLSTLIGFRRGI
ncbi:hypothetical protein ARMGADRAFT_1079991 [Armillaria gallica]|uniref:Uncharacterized protein n=1 Tax=Armillaria gallica TaxID=47427 RepID=A0A2H3DZG8_ARMGA|nr:hypothetical protein ARMGADRAFT_1079991 [Armillaria gallica]